MLQRPSKRRSSRLSALLLSGSLALAAPAQNPPPAPDATAAEVAALELESIRPWEITGNFRAAAGYKENLLLSAVQAEDSPFVQAEAELLWWRLPTERFEALAFANTTLTHFTASAENPREWQAFAHAEARWFARPDLRATAIVEGYHLDQVFDLSASQAERLTARLAVTGALVTAPLRWDVRPTTWLELTPTAQRDRYRDGSDDNAQRIGRVTVGHAFLAGRLEIALAGQALRRDYAFRPQYTGAGRPQPGTDLAFAQREGEARVSVIWDRAGHWRSTSAAVRATNDDNGSGYFNFHQRTMRQEISWTRAPWKARLNGRVGRYDYDVQTEGIGIDPPKR